MWVSSFENIGRTHPNYVRHSVKISALTISISCYNSYLKMSIKIGLDRIKPLLEHVNYTRPTVHIVGTNGKGSVSTLIEHVLLSSGLSVGKFTSPHLVHVYDCISVNGG